MSSYFQVIAEYHVKTGEESAVLAQLARLTAASREEPGNLAYDYFQSPVAPSHLVIVERYTDEAAFEAHRTSEHFAAIAVELIVPLLADRSVRTFTGEE